MFRQILLCLLLIVPVLLGGCGDGSVTVSLPGGHASVTLPGEPKSVVTETSMRVYLGEPDSPEDQPLWRQTDHKVKITTYLVETDPQYPWGVQVFEFSPEAVEKEGEHLFDYAQTQIIIPGPYEVKVHNGTTVQGLPAVDVMAEQTNGKSRIEARLVRRDDMIFGVFFESAIDGYPKGRAHELFGTFKVSKPGGAK